MYEFQIPKDNSSFREIYHPDGKFVGWMYKDVNWQWVGIPWSAGEPCTLRYRNLDENKVEKWVLRRGVIPAS